MRTAKQVIVSQFGGPHVLQVVDAPVRSPKAGQLLVRVEAAGVLYGDVMRRTDRYVAPTPLPYAPGTEIAGTVAKVGEGVSTHEVGDRVLSRVGSDGYAQYALAEAADAILLPEAIGFDVATALLAQGTTAYLLTHDAAMLSGKSVFIESAAGGVGVLMVQMARALGASFIAGSASSPEKREFARENGVDFALDSKKQGWAGQLLQATDGRGIDVAFESSGTGFSELLTCLSAFGTLVKFGRGVDEKQSLDPALLLGKNQTLRGFYLPGYFDPLHRSLREEAMRFLMASVLNGELKIRIDHRLSLRQAALGHRAIEERNTMGKVVLEPWSDEV
jgi:NADPH2:quinone reductase